MEHEFVIRTLKRRAIKIIRIWYKSPAWMSQVMWSRALNR